MQFYKRIQLLLWFLFKQFTENVYYIGASHNRINIPNRTRKNIYAGLWYDKHYRLFRDPYYVQVLYVRRSFCNIFVLVKCGRYVRLRSRITPRYFGFLSCLTLLPLNFILNRRLASRLFKWKTQDTVLETFGWVST